MTCAPWGIGSSLKGAMVPRRDAEPVRAGSLLAVALLATLARAHQEDGEGSTAVDLFDPGARLLQSMAT